MGGLYAETAYSFHGRSLSNLAFLAPYSSTSAVDERTEAADLLTALGGLREQSLACSGRRRCSQVTVISGNRARPEHVSPLRAKGIGIIDGRSYFFLLARLETPQDCPARGNAQTAPHLLKRSSTQRLISCFRCLQVLNQ